MFCARCHREYEDDALFCPYDGEPLSSSAKIDLLRAKPTSLGGAVLGDRYKVRGFIGKGAMARVYLAEDLLTGQPVAVKVLDTRVARSRHARDRFLRESDAANRIGHPNIVEIYSQGERADGSPFIVMEFLFGESLGELLRRELRLSADIALPILRQAASGLSAAHRAGIVHRDVKPDNLFLVGEPGDPYAVKILDFGLAKLSDQSGLTQAGVAVGTLEYMSPEQVLTDRIDERTDIYGLGVVMYRMFTGALPFEAKDDADLLAHQLISRPRPATERAPGVDPAVAMVIARAMQKRPENRYRSMTDFHDDLERLLGDRGGTLAAASGTLLEPDVYEPESTFAKHAARFFYRRLGITPPAWGD